jgi:hypothetical protein
MKKNKRTETGDFQFQSHRFTIGRATKHREVKSASFDQAQSVFHPIFHN